jgi:hypothetical protein
VAGKAAALQEASSNRMLFCITGVQVFWIHTGRRRLLRLFALAVLLLLTGILDSRDCNGTLSVRARNPGPTPPARRPARRPRKTAAHVSQIRPSEHHFLD